MRRTTSVAALGAVIPLCLSTSSAWAQDTGGVEPPATPSATTASPPPPAPSSSAGTAPGSSAVAPAPAGATAPFAKEDPEWRYDYGIARDRLLAGDFGDAAERFAALVPRAKDPADRDVVENLGQLAQSWADRKLALVKRNDLGETPVTAKAVGERTTDEIAGLYAATIAYGIGTGLWIEAHTQSDSVAAWVLPMIGVAGAGAGTVALLDIGHPLHYGVPQSITTGLGVGLYEGIAIGGWGATNPSTHWNGTTVADVVWGFSTAGALAGGVIGAEAGTTPGRSAFVGSLALYSGLLGGLVTAALDNNDNYGTDALLAGALTLNAGVIGGLLAAGPVSPTIGRVRFLDVGALGGGLLVGGLYLAAANHNIDPHAASGATAIGMGAGLTVAWLATAKMPQDRLKEDKDDKTKDARVSPLLKLQPTFAPINGGAAVGVAGLL